MILDIQMKNRWVRIFWPVHILVFGLLCRTAQVSAADGPPMIVGQPQDQTVLQGDPASFSVQVDGTQPMRFQWLRNGAPVSAATNNSYLLPATVAADNLAQFSVLLTNDLGNA